MTEPLLRVRGLSKAFGGVTVLDGVDLDVAPGGVTCLLGPSGSGKSTLLRCVNHLETVDAGTVEVGGELIGYRRDGDLLRELGARTIAVQRRRIGMVFQDFGLFGHMTALGNVAEAPTTVLGRPRAEAERRGRELIAQVGLAGREDAYPRQLSGGQQQRIAIARALAMDPLLMLFDEPTSALDPQLVGEVLAVLRDLAAGGTTMVVVTHEIAFAREVADTVVVLDGGRVVEAGPPSQVLPFRIIPRLLSTAFARRCQSLDGARSLLDLALFAKMDESEQQEFAAYAKSKRGMTADELKTEMAETTLACSENWDGYRRLLAGGRPRALPIVSLSILHTSSPH